MQSSRGLRRTRTRAAEPVGLAWPKPTEHLDWAEQAVVPQLPSLVSINTGGYKPLSRWVWYMVAQRGLPALGLMFHHVFGQMFGNDAKTGSNSANLAKLAMELLMGIGVLRLHRAMQLRRLPRWAGRVLRVLCPGPKVGIGALAFVVSGHFRADVAVWSSSQCIVE